MPRYLLDVTDEDAVRLEKWLGGPIQIVPVKPSGLLGEVLAPFMGDIKPVSIAALDAVTDAECKPITRRLATGGPLYHAGGPAR